MKIGCPECGQHYEIDSNMLDRYYRCTECKSLFWGLNAKPVKTVKFKRKKAADDEAADDTAAIDNALKLVETTAEEKVEDISAEKEEPTAVESDGETAVGTLENGAEDKENIWLESDVPVIHAVEPVIRWERPAAVAALVLALIALITAWVGNSRGNDHDDALAALQNKCKEQLKQINTMEQKLISLQNDNQYLREHLTLLERAKDQMTTKLNDNKVAQQIKEYGDTVDQMSYKLSNLIQLSEKVDDMAKRLEDLEGNGEDEKARRRQRQR